MRKFVEIAFVAILTAVAGYGFYTSQKTEVMSDLALANIEALANNTETGTGCTASATCGNGSVSCSGTTCVSYSTYVECMDSNGNKSTAVCGC